MPVTRAQIMMMMRPLAAWWTPRRGRLLMRIAPSRRNLDVLEVRIAERGGGVRKIYYNILGEAENARKGALENVYRW